MIETLLEPFAYEYMLRAIWVSALVGSVCAFLSCYLILKGWSLIGDALSHSIVPGVALAYILSLPYSLGAFFAGFIAAGSMVWIKKETRLKEDAIIGLVFTTFFAIGLLMFSINPIAVNIQAIILGNLLTISHQESVQILIISIICTLILIFNWKNFLAVFFDERHAKSIGIETTFYKILFFTLLSAATVAALQTVGACLVIAMVITPGATAYLLSDRFGKMISLSIVIGSISNALGTYLSFYMDANSGGLIVCIQTVLFITAFIFAPKHGMLKHRKKEVIHG
ncbi:MAG: metal ABC transporter permease [Micavibrio sp.]|nr:metal ABC transporter permease [Micavibrio sp.]